MQRSGSRSILWRRPESRAIYVGVGSGATEACPSGASSADRSPFEFTGKITRVVFDINPHLTEADRQAIHEHEQHAALAHGMGA